MENAITKRDRNFSHLYAFIALLLICFYLVTELVFQLWYDVAQNYGLFLIISFIAISFFLRFFSSTKEEKCLALYALWVLVTRVLNGDMFLNVEFSFLVRIVLFTECFICIGFVLDSEDRKRFLNLVCAIVCGYWFILAVIGLYATVNLTRIALPPSDMTVGLATVGVNKQLTVENINRNVSGVWFALAVTLMLYQFYMCRRKFLRIPIVIAAIVFYFATAMSFCRAAEIGLCVAVAMLFILLALKRFSQNNVKFKALIVAAIIVVVLPVCYLGYGLATDLCNIFSTEAVEKQEEVQSAETAKLLSASNKPATEHKLLSASEVKNEKKAFTEYRDTENVMAMNSRAPLWKAGMIVLQEEPERLIKGGLIGQYMERVSDVRVELYAPNPNSRNEQMHNYILDSLMLTGVPGALILIIFTMFLLVRVVRVFFSADPAVPFQLKLLTLPIVMLLLDNMAEAHIFRYAIMPSILFFLICGVFLAWSYEVLPGAKKK